MIFSASKQLLLSFLDNRLIGTNIQTSRRMAKMQEAYSKRNVEKTTLNCLSYPYVFSILELSVLLPITRFINYRFTPPLTKINDCNNISVNEQANIADVHQLFIVPVCSLFMWIVCCGLFCLQKVSGYFNHYS